MAEDAPEQSMEDVLSSIKRIISADVEAARRFPKPSAVLSVADEDDDVLELGETARRLDIRADDALDRRQ
ncbi:MAG TPA: hypothetical protein VK533_02470, partial [Sphingomonas sp.]|nr:hypothetical protein [Sphingomonas sp.]